MRVLAIDTAANLCAACIFDEAADVELGRAVLDLGGKGHAETLIGVIETALRAAACHYRDIGRIGVSIGPGSFTGVRIGWRPRVGWRSHWPSKPSVSPRWKLLPPKHAPYRPAGRPGRHPRRPRRCLCGPSTMTRGPSSSAPRC
jgi:hypothetical protein